MSRLLLNNQPWKRPATSSQFRQSSPLRSRDLVGELVVQRGKLVGVGPGRPSGCSTRLGARQREQRWGRPASRAHADHVRHSQLRSHTSWGAFSVGSRKGGVRLSATRSIALAGKLNAVNQACSSVQYL